MHFHLAAIVTFISFGVVPPGPAVELQDNDASQPAESLNRLWTSLADMDAAKAYLAILTMTETPKESVALIANKLERAVPPDQRQVERWIEDLNDEAFAVRDKATLELTKRGDLVQTALRRALQANPSLETRRRIEKLLIRLLGPTNNPEQLRAVRVVETLEIIGTTEAKTLLAKYAAGAPGVRLTQDASDALDRLQNAAAPMAPTGKSRTDLYGDPLPRGAVGRLGTVRFRWSSNGSFGPEGMAFLPDGKSLIAGDDRAVRVFEVPSGKLLHEIPVGLRIRHFVLAPDAKQFAVSGAAYSPEGQLEFNGIHVCALPSGKVIRSFARKRGDVSIAFSPDSKLLFSLSGSEGSVRIEEIASGKKLARKNIQADDSAELAVSADGTYLAINAGVNIRKQFLWKWRDDEPRQLEPTLEGRGLGAIRLSPDGKLLAGLQGFRTLYAWEVPSGRLLWQCQCPENGFMFLGDMAFTPDGKTLAVTIRKEQTTSWGQIALLDPITGQSQGIVDSTTPVRRLAISGDSRLMASAARSGVRLWDMTSRRELTAGFEGHEHYPTQIIVSPKGFLATISDDIYVRIWDAATTKQRQRFVATDWVRTIGVSPNSNLLAASTLGEAVQVWDMNTSREIHRLAGHGKTGGRRALAFFPDGKGLLSWGDDCRLRGWDLKAGNARFEHPIPPHNRDDDERDTTLVGTAFSPDGRTFVLDIGGLIHLFDTATGKESLKFAKDGRLLSNMAVTPNGKTLAVSAWGDRPEDKHPISLFDLATGTTLLTLSLASTVGGPVAFSADGRMFATSVERPTREILILECASGRVRYTIRGLTSRVWSLAFFPDGRRLASGLNDSTVMIWDLTAPES